MRARLGLLLAIAILAACPGEQAPSDPICAALAGCPGGAGCPALATEPGANLGFFVTSVGNGARGGNYGGLAGADARCQCLAASVGRGQRTWRAYLSTSLEVKVHARDRIGPGPWINFAGVEVAASVDGLHAQGIAAGLMLTETGTTAPPGDHDVLTGSDADGRAFSSFPGNPQLPPPTCRDWTDDQRAVLGYVGHSDWSLPDSQGQRSWNAAHETRGCAEAALRETAGSGRLYCFAVD